MAGVDGTFYQTRPPDPSPRWRKPEKAGESAGLRDEAFREASGV